MLTQLKQLNMLKYLDGGGDQKWRPLQKYYRTIAKSWLENVLEELLGPRSSSQVHHGIDINFERLLGEMKTISLRQHVSILFIWSNIGLVV